MVRRHIIKLTLFPSGNGLKEKLRSDRALSGAAQVDAAIGKAPGNRVLTHLDIDKVCRSAIFFHGIHYAHTVPALSILWSV